MANVNKATVNKATVNKANVNKANVNKANVNKAVPKPAPAPAPVVPPPVAVALRGGLAIVAVTLTGKPYRSAAAHNTAWWAQVTQATAQGAAPVAALLKAGVPSHFVGYTVRRGYLQAAA